MNQRTIRALAICTAVTLAAWIGSGIGTAAAAMQTSTSPAGAYVCPMHPDVRSSTPGKCPVCGMDLIPRSPRTGDYLLDLRVSPPAPVPGREIDLSFAIREPESGEPVREFEMTHERPFHLFVVSSDLEYFAHIHPRPGRDGRMHVSTVLPRPAPYQLYADFTPVGGAPQLLQRSVVTAGFRGTLEGSRAHLTPDLTPKTDHDLRMRVRLPDAVAGRDLLITASVEEARTGATISDLQPYLGAEGHLMMISEDLVDAVHSHPVSGISDAHGPDVVFQARFPRAGLYRFWIQVQRAGEVSTFAFTVPVMPPG